MCEFAPYFVLFANHVYKLPAPSSAVWQDMIMISSQFWLLTNNKSLSTVFLSFIICISPTALVQNLLQIYHLAFRHPSRLYSTIISSLSPTTKLFAFFALLNTPAVYPLPGLILIIKGSIKPCCAMLKNWLLLFITLGAVSQCRAAIFRTSSHWRRSSKLRRNNGFSQKSYPFISSTPFLKVAIINFVMSRPSW